MTKTVLHVHQDYPDGVYQYPYTKAVSNLVHAVEKSHPEYKHYVISINRTANPFKVKWQPFDGGMAFVYWGIPFQFMHFITLWLATLLIRFAIRGQHYDLVHSHKLTTEGFIGAALAKEKKLTAFKHNGFWYSMDTLRDKKHLENLWSSNKAPWKTW